MKQIQEDEFGNQLVWQENGRVVLYLKSEEKPRLIGTIITLPSGEMILRKMANEAKHLFRKANAWGVCFAVMDEFLKPDSHIIIESERAKYTLTAKEIREKGDFLFFKEQGFERQIFVNLNEWRCYERKD